MDEMSDADDWQPAVTQIHELILDGMTKLRTVWTEMGVPKTARLTRYKQVYEHHKGLMQDMVNEAEQSKKDLLEELKTMMNEATALSMELRIKFDTAAYQELPLLEIRDKVIKHVQKFRSNKQQRLNFVEEFAAKEYDICKSLGIKPQGITIELPDETEMRGFEMYLEKIEAEKLRKELAFAEKRKQLVTLMNDLGITPSTEFERMVYMEPENFVFSQTNLANLSEVVESLELQVNQAKLEVENKQRELENLWKYLDESVTTCQEFVARHPKYDVQTLKAYDSEINRCKIKRSENISKCVMKIREQIKCLWEQCHIGEAERREFHFMQSQTFSDDLLVLHEMEMERLQKYYEDHRQLFQLLEERDVLWEKWADLEKRANDPNRFHNRGGQLLIEEKERKVLQKQFPKITEDIQALLDQYEMKNGKPFTVNGVPVTDRLKQSCIEYNAAKQIVLQARKQAREQLDKSKKNTPLSVSKRTPLTVSMKQGASTSKKRKDGDLTPYNPPSKKRNISSDTNRPKYNASKLKRRSTKQVSRRIFQTSRGDQNARPSSAQQSHVASTNETVSSYGEFQQHLENRNELRSSVLPQNVLTVMNNRSHTTSRIKTPIKPVRKNIPTLTPRRGTPNKLTITPRGTPRSPRIKSTSRLAPAPNSQIPFII